VQVQGGLRSRSRRWQSAGNWPGHWAGASVAAPTAASGHRPPARGQSPRAARLRRPSRACAAARLRGLHAAPLRRCCHVGCWRAPTGCCRVGLNRAEEVLVLHTCSLQGPRATASAQHTRYESISLFNFYFTSMIQFLISIIQYLIGNLVIGMTDFMMSKRTIHTYFSSSSASTPHTNESASQPQKPRAEFSHSDLIGTLET